MAKKDRGADDRARRLEALLGRVEEIEAEWRRRMRRAEEDEAKRQRRAEEIEAEWQRRMTEVEAEQAKVAAQLSLLPPGFDSLDEWGRQALAVVCTAIATVRDPSTDETKRAEAVDKATATIRLVSLLS